MAANVYFGSGRNVERWESYWSDQHKALLLYAAERVLRVCPNSNIEIEDLVGLGWHRCLRTRKESELHNCFDNVYCTMQHYILYERKQVLHCRSSLLLWSYESNADEVLLDTADPTDYFAIIDTKLDVEYLLGLVTPRQADILIRHCKGESYRDIGRQYGCSHERIRQYYNEALNELKMACRVAKKE